MKHNLFINRDDAYNQLCEVLPLDEMRQEPWIVIAISAGAVPIAFELSKNLLATFDFMFTYKICASKNDECEIAIITETEEIIIQDELMRSFDIKLDDIYSQANDMYNTHIQDYIKKYRDGQSISKIVGKNILFVDEGLNTGLTMMACIKSAISEGASSVAVAVPVLPEATIADIASIADDLFYVNAPAHFLTIDFYYEELEEISLTTINKIINKDKNNVNNI